MGCGGSCADSSDEEKSSALLEGSTVPAMAREFVESR